MRRGPLLGVALAAVASAAAAQGAPTTIACDSVFDSREAYEAAFLAEGWTLVEGEDREAALALPATLLGFITAMPGASADADGFAALRAQVEAAGRAALADAAVFVRGEERAAVQVLTKAGEGDVIRCVFAGRALPEVETLIASGGGLVSGDMQIVPSLRDPQPGETATATNGLRLAPAWDDAAPLDGLIVSHTLVIGDGTS